MRLDFTNERVLAVVAHPDDAELLCAGTLARAKSDGAAIGIAVLCNGDGGQPHKPIRNLAAVRRREMDAAARLLGAELFCGNISDGTLADDRPTRLLLTEIYRRFRPSLILAHSLADYHTDHRVAGVLAEVASWFCASRGQKTKSAPLPASPVLWWMDTVNMSGFEPGFYVDVSGFMSLKEKMLACHRSQMARSADSSFSPLLDLMRLQARARGTQAGVAAAEAFRAHHAFKRARAW
ncbi:MAG: PIG-L family deacetylase [Verrucomicrobia bacterium]|nr:PIG-L family deacetylase [Verrucomicrobiota bacterium]